MCVEWTEVSKLDLLMAWLKDTWLRLLLLGNSDVERTSQEWETSERVGRSEGIEFNILLTILGSYVSGYFL